MEKRNKIFYKLLGIFAGLSFILSIIYGIIYFGLARGDLFDSIIVDEQLEENLGIPSEQLEYAMDEMISYVKSWDESESAQVQVMVNGQKVDFYVENEMSHLKDVKLLIKFLDEVFMGLFLTGIVIAVVLWRKKRLRELGWGYFIALGIVAVLALIVAIIACSDMSDFISLFHGIFFSQGGWVFDLDKSRIVWFFSDGLYQKALVILGLSMTIILGGIAVFDAIYLKKVNQSEKMQMN